MAKTKGNNQIFIWIAIIALAFFLFVKLPKGTTQSTVTNVYNTTVTNYLNQQTPSQGSCSLTVDKTSICSGETVTVTVTDGIQANCIAFATLNGGPWQQVAQGTTGTNGVAIASTPVNQAGTYVMRVLCGQCVTNQVTLTVNDCACTDSDGDDRDTPGHVIDASGTYYDRCLAVGQGVTEYICESGRAKTKNWACDYGEICIQTRSGGKCTASNTDTDGDGIPDNTDTGPTACSATWPTPNSQSSCNSRTGCSTSQVCMYFPATLATVARCNCVTPV